MKSFSKLLLIFTFILSALDLTAGPTIIRDNRVTDLATTPVLGRGYSIGTNTFQSTCMEKVVITEPSYDMKYSFTQLESKGTEKRATSEEESSDRSTRQRQSRATSSTKSSLSAIPFVGVRASLSGNYSSTRSGIDTSIKSISKSTVIAGKTYYSHSMLATISLYSYYASVDESRSKLSRSAKMLLASKDLPGFFSGCGPYYVRSIGRKAVFVSIFTYQSESQTRDESFEDQLRSEVSSFSTESKTKFSAKASYGWSANASLSTNKTTQAQSAKDIEEQKRRNEFNSKSESYRLTINTSAYGLGKDKKATLISFDMDTFKVSVKDAFLAMQSPTTGKVSSIEVVPWVENTEFQALVPLESEEIPQDTTADTDKPPKRQLLYEKKHILNQNAEFFMEIERSDRNKMNMYYKARLCKKNIDMNFKDEGELKPEFMGAYLVNHRGGPAVTIEFLDQKITKEYVKGLLKNETDFMYGPDDDTPGASDCIRQIITSGIYKKSYRQIEECRSILEQLGDVQSDLLENFCMPEIAGY